MKTKAIVNSVVINTSPGTPTHPETDDHELQKVRRFKFTGRVSLDNIDASVVADS